MSMKITAAGMAWREIMAYQRLEKRKRGEAAK
jgi:hypothetical protein